LNIGCENREESQYELDDSIFSIEIGMDVKLELEFTWMDFGGWSPERLLHAGLNTGLMCNLHGKEELELKRKT
jgi:hypothetical protein